MALPENGVPVVIVGSEQPLAEALAGVIRSAGGAVILSEFPPADAQMIIDISGLSNWSAHPAGSAQKAAIACARAVAPRFEARGGNYVVIGRAKAGWQAGHEGLAKTASLEWPLALVKAILLEEDLERENSPSEVAIRIFAEIMQGGPEVEVALTSSGRLVPVSPMQAVASGPALQLPDGSVLVVSGGARGVTAECIIALAGTGRYRFALLGRSIPEEWPEGLVRLRDEAALRAGLIAMHKAEGSVPAIREINARLKRLLATLEIDETLSQLRSHGAEVRYIACNVEDEAGVEEALSVLRADWGPVHGLIHGAGVLADKRIADKDDDQVDRVFGPKVRGLQVLLSALKDDPLVLLALFSSVAARAGKVGQADYAMANSVLNQIARLEAERRPGCVVKSIVWGPWDGGMVNEQLRRHFEELGIPLIPAAEGGELFVHELLHSSSDQPEVVISGPFLLPERSYRAALKLGPTDLAMLRDHVIRGRAVLPIVMAVQAMLSFGGALLPHCPVVGLDDFEVLAGVSFETVERYAAEHFCLTGILRAQAPDQLEITLATSDGRVRYRAKLVGRGLELNVVPTALVEPATRLTAKDAYQGLLFHGPSFQAISSLISFGPEGADALLNAGSGRHSFDAVLCDGGLQVALLWAVERGLWPSLPIGFSGLRLGRRPPQGQVVTVHDRVTNLDGPIVTHQLTYMVDGQPVMLLSGLQMCRSPQQLVS
jgi:NAD(P)-dependent dehydrogenase (short-subunit alcohol dehydrogenase family)